MLTQEEISRYSRQMILPQIGVVGQEKLKSARVLVVGMGGLGSPVSMYLAAAGVGTLGLADFDAVELSNLHRQVLHGTADVGSPKVESARKRLEHINPHCRLVIHPHGIRAEDLPSLFEGYDVIVDGTDNFGTRYMNNDAAVLAGKPLVYGSIFQFEGQASVFHPASGGPCYRCLFPTMPDPATVPNCAEAGVIGALCSIVGGIQAMEAVKWITGAGELLLNRLMVFDTLSMQPRVIRVARDPECPVCSAQARIRSIEPDEYVWSCEVPEQTTESLPVEIDPQEAKRLAENEGALLLDVREPMELDICRIEGARHIPLRQIPTRYDELPRDRTLITFCHHGMRATAAARELKVHGFTHLHVMRGGVDQWAVDIDPQMNRY